MKTTSLNQAKTLILAEYPYFEKHQPTITKQFKSPNGRVYNTFLINSKHPQHRQIIAKGTIYNSQSLLPEWLTYQFLQSKTINCPRLIFPYHQPTNYLLQTYINGTPASQMSNPQLNKHISQIALTTAQCHSIAVRKNCQKIKTHSDWTTLIKQKFTERFAASRQWLNQDEIAKSKEILKNNLPDIKSAPHSNRLIHRDIYLDNFIICQNKAYLIDFGMTESGDPHYDFGKFIMLTLYHHPQLTSPFLNAYQKSSRHIILRQDLIIFYTLLELLGTLCFSHKIRQKKYHSDTLLKTQELLADSENFTKIISQFSN